ncbi:MAG: type II 3-dehydroquinate dehydratase [Christensenella sp.]
MKKIIIINGPNLNLLGKRETTVYGDECLESIEKEIKNYCDGMKILCEFYQSNHEGDIIEKIHEVMDNYDGCIINAGAYTHYSYAIRDAIASVRKPFVEVHMSNIYKREEFRHKSVLAEVCMGQISGFGKNSYVLAVKAISDCF